MLMGPLSRPDWRDTMSLPHQDIAWGSLDIDVRGLRLGHALVDRALQALAQTWGPQPIRIAAQAHLQAFYAQHGFAPVSEPYQEDGISHVDMLRPAL